ncbi:hypothetical protein GCM10007937_42810 [Mesorhizobium albiziae]|nr:hypothetical protein GCM10007937_42810 [Mesorhizobium albiziae]
MHVMDPVVAQDTGNPSRVTLLVRAGPHFVYPAAGTDARYLVCFRTKIR